MSALTDLRSSPQWVAWRNEKRPNGKPTKVPYVALGRKAEADDPSAWLEHDQAVELAKVLVNGLGGGTGIELGQCGPLWVVGVDLDTCRDPTYGVIEPWAAAVIDRLNSYAEVSPSGTGVKVFAQLDPADVPKLRAVMGTLHGRRWTRRNGSDHLPAIELHISNRYFAVTWEGLPDSPTELRIIPVSDLQWLIKHAGPEFARTKKTGTDKSRSAAAFRLGAELRRQQKTFEEMVAVLRDHPDTADWVAEKGEANDQRELRRIWDRVEPFRSNKPNEDRAATVFAARFANDLRYCHHTGKWHEWVGTHWRPDETKLAFSWARAVCRDSGMSKAQQAAAVERFAQADQTLAVTSSVWDQDPYLLGTPSGTVDLRTGELRPADPREYISKLTSVGPAETADCPIWFGFLEQVTRGDRQMTAFLKRWHGYTLTGDTQEHKLLFAWGPGGNGKSVMMNTTGAVFGDYCVTAAMDSFVVTRSDRHTTDMAMLAGARLVMTTEIEEGRTWDQAKVNQLTGGDPVTARFMRQNNFTYIPQFKLGISGNNKPRLKNVDDAARRRIVLAPFLFKPAIPDGTLKDRLIPERPAILRWMIEGCLEWQREGLNPPESVQAATDDYFHAQNDFGRWIEECCERDLYSDITPTDALKSFQGWCARNGEPLIDSRRFHGLCEKMDGLYVKKTNGVRVIRGLRLKPATTFPEENLADML